MKVPVVKILVPASMFLAALTAPSYAYLDPASGSALMAAVLGFFATVAYVARKQFYRLLRLFRRKSQPKD